MSAISEAEGGTVSGTLFRPETGNDHTLYAITAWYRQHPSKEDRAIAFVLEDILKAEKDSRHRRE
jgi:hypothetical protein